MWASRLAASVAVGVVGGIGWFRGGSGIAGWWWGRGAIGERSEGLMGLGRVGTAPGLAVGWAGCGGMGGDGVLPRGWAAYGGIRAPDAGAPAAAYRTGWWAVLRGRVFRGVARRWDGWQWDARG